MFTRFFQRLTCGAVALLFLSGAASIGIAPNPQPALWKITKGGSTVYLFGSVHILPREWEWRTAAIDKAIAASDTFVFEASLEPADRSSMQAFVRQNGSLPEGKRLSTMLSPKGLKTLNKVLEMTPIDLETVDRFRPWLALVILTDSRIAGRAIFDEGVDSTLETEVFKDKKRVRYLETAQAQIGMLMQITPDGDIPGFEHSLDELLKADDMWARLFNSWIVGDTVDLAKIINEGAQTSPREKRLLLDNRNRNWIPQIEKMLEGKRTTFVTVGAAHLVGPGSVMEALCVRGWHVERIKTGPSASAPRLACPSPLKLANMSPARLDKTALRQ